MITRIEDGVPPSKSTYMLHRILESTVLSPFSFEEYNVIPPAGKLWNILTMYAYIQSPMGATFGEHSYTLKSSDTHMNFLRGESVFSSDVEWDYSGWNIANSEQKPNTTEAAHNALTSIYMINIRHLVIRYINGTDVDQHYARDIRLSVLETPLI